LDAVSSGGGGSDWFTAFDDTDLVGGLLLLVGAVVFALVLIPILLFGFELVIAGVLLAAGLAGRTVLGKPWTVEARALDGSDRIVCWRVTGWRRSKKLIDQLRHDLAAGREPEPEVDVPQSASL
jgi:hypothetical protein